MFEILLKKVAEQLDGQGLPYMIIGGQAFRISHTALLATL